MSVEVLELGVIVTSGVIIVSVVYELCFIWLRHEERKRR